jgi:hypothetical protein
MLFGLLRPRRLTRFVTAADLAQFLDEKTALISQKSLVGYCEVKTNLPLSELMREKRFADAYEVARWEAFAVVLAGLVVVTESYLRPATAQTPGCANAALVEIFAHVLARYPVPAHRPQGWDDRITALRERLAQVQLAPPQPVAVIAERAGEQLYAVMPIYESLREPDRPAIVANVQFMMVGLAHQFTTQIEPTTLVAALCEAATAT